MIENQTNEANWTNQILPYMADVGAFVAMGMGYYLYRHYRKPTEETKPDEKEAIRSAAAVHQMILNNTDKAKGADNFLEIAEKNNMTPDIITYNCLIEMYLKFEDFVKAETIYGEINDPLSPVQPDEVTYNILLKGIVTQIQINRKNQEKLAFFCSKLSQLKSEAEKKGLTLGNVFFNTIIDAYSESAQLTKALDILTEMKSNGLEPDCYTYSTLFKAFKTTLIPDGLTRVMELFSEFQAKSAFPGDEIIYNSVMDCCVKYNDLDMLERVFEDMKTNVVRPSEITFSIMIKGYNNSMKLKRVKELVEDMQTYGVTPSVSIYSGLLNSAIKARNLKLMQTFYQEMRENKVEPNFVVYTCLIKGFSRFKRFEDAFSTFAQMKKDANIQMNIGCFNSVLDVCVESQSIEKMESIFEELLETQMEPNLITYSTLIKGYCRAKQMNKAQSLFDQVIETGEFDEVLFNTMMDGYAKNDNEEGLYRIFSQMKQSKIAPSAVVYSILIKFHSRKGNQAAVSKVLKEMSRKKIQKSLVVYTALIQFYIKTKKIHEVFKILKEMKEKEISLDRVLYNFVINGFSFNRKLESAIEYLIEATELKIKLADDTYRNVFNYLITNKFMKIKDKVWFAKNVLTALKNASIEIEYSSYSRLAKLVYSNEF